MELTITEVRGLCEFFGESKDVSYRCSPNQFKIYFNWMANNEGLIQLSIVSKPFLKPCKTIEFEYSNGVFLANLIQERLNSKI